MSENRQAGIPERLLAELDGNPAVMRLDEGRGVLPMTSLIQEALVIAASYRHHPRPVLVVKQNLYQAQRLYERVRSLLGEEECALFGADESLRVEAIAVSPEMTAGKVETLASMLENGNQVVITNPAGLLRHLPSPETFRQGCIVLRAGETMDMKELRMRLLNGGYSQTSHIDQPLTFACRGGIVDVYSINYDQPVRIEFFDNEIDSVRFFDIDTQKTLKAAEEVKIVPASDVLFTEADVAEIRQKTVAMAKEKADPFLTSAVENDMTYLEGHIREARLYPYFSFLDRTSSLADYLPDPQIILSDKDALDNSVRHLMEETTAYIQEMVQESKMLPHFSMWHDFSRLLDKHSCMLEDPFCDNLSGITQIHLPNETLEVRLKMLNPEVRTLFCLNGAEVKRIIDACIAMHRPYKLISGGEEIEEGFSISVNPLLEGFSYPQKNLQVLTAAELFEIRHKAGRYETKFRNAEVIHSYQDLEPQDYVVHAQHGIGQYMGIETKEIQGIKHDFLRIIYRGNAELLVPLDQFRLVRKFVSREGVVPKLSKLGSDEWQKTKERLETDVRDLAERLVKLYSARGESIGYAFHEDSEEEKEFDASFEYDLTPDQKIAVEAVKKDMMSPKPMDRLICGDVGFGKTEVAVRASFKAVADGKQVAVLCPTTILAEQHFRTFRARYRDCPVTIKVLDRFVQPAVQKQILQDLTSGRIDILIGTHRILSKDVQFHDLGLLVVDEEQRFGVEHKEKIKELKNGIDVLSLSATPIPRTLQMSLVGIRQLSQLETPPLNRYSVQTYVVEKNDGLIKDAIEKELARDGQVFYLHNNIDQIYNTARKLQVLLPEARIGIAHGQMDRDEIENVMMQFNNHEMDVLVCTTIIENGIDIPNANTILIDNAQDFGLAQIYQIKGRVGRSDRVAYAYLMVPARRQLSEVAAKRLQAVKEFARLGSGYKVAMRDLTIRGAGDLLGPEQSGFIDTVGIDMYIEMLNEAIEEKRGIVKKAEEPALPHAPVQADSYIPKEFAPDDFDKIGMYKRIDEIRTQEDLNVYRLEVEDEYGRLPQEVQVLFAKKRLEILLNDPDVKGYREIKGQAEIIFSPAFSAKVNGVKLFEIFTTISRDITIRYQNNCIYALLPKSKDSLAVAIEVLSRAKEAIRS